MGGTGRGRKSGFFLMFIYFWDREWQREGAKRERVTEKPKWAQHWQQRAQCGSWTHEPWDHMTWAKVRHLTGWATHPEREREREGGRVLSRLHTQHGAQCRTRPHDPEIMTWAEIKSQTLNWLNHPDTPQDLIFNVGQKVHTFTILPLFLSMMTEDLILLL